MLRPHRLLPSPPGPPPSFLQRYPRFITGLGVYLLCLAVYLMSSSGHFSSTDHVSVYLTTQSLIEHGNLAIKPINDTMRGPDGRFYGVDGQPWNLEVERTPKRLDRLREVIGIRAEASRKSRVLYVLDRRFSDFYREQMAISVNPECFYVAHFDDLSRASCVGRPGVSSPLKRLFGGVV